MKSTSRKANYTGCSQAYPGNLMIILEKRDNGSEEFLKKDIVSS